MLWLVSRESTDRIKGGTNISWKGGVCKKIFLSRSHFAVVEAL